MRRTPQKFRDKMRAARLLRLIELLRLHRRAVSGERLAATLSVSRRTVYRDIQALKALGAVIDGEAGVGYVIRPGFILPPLMFSADQLEAIVLGARMVSQSADAPLASAARDALAKIASVLPSDDGLDAIAGIGLLSGPRPPAAPDGVALARIRQAIRAEHRVVLNYKDAIDQRTTRTVWPIALTFGNQIRLLATWCELREDFRTFRVDRILAMTETAERYPRRRRSLLKAWRQAQGVPASVVWDW
jgi:predicted DNA-binding transcriptional regulator YafY